MTLRFTGMSHSRTGLEFETETALALGLAQGIVLSGIYWWQRVNEARSAYAEEMFVDERWWHCGTPEQWCEWFGGIWQEGELTDMTNALVKLGLMHSISCYNDDDDTTVLWYSVDEAAYDAFIALWKSCGSPPPAVQTQRSPYPAGWREACPLKQLPRLMNPWGGKRLSPSTNQETAR